MPNPTLRPYDGNNLPPSSSVSEPAARPSAMRPASRRRPKTSKPRKPPTARPDTSASGIGDLPDQEFYPEESDLEEGEEYEEESEEDENTFAFRRPQTAAVPVVAFAENDPSAPTTGVPPAISDPLNSTGLRHRFSVDGPRDEIGPIEIGSYFYEPAYDPHNPPALSGRNNPNNQLFAFSADRRAEHHAPPPPVDEPTVPPPAQLRPPTGRSLLSRLQRRDTTTAATDMTRNTHLTATSAGVTGTSWNSSDHFSDSGSFSDASLSHAASARRVRSKTRLIDGGASDMTSERPMRRATSRGSYGLTEFTGDMTVADGRTTYGDGQGNVSPGIKYGSDEEGGVVHPEWDPLDEDSPYPEVRASVSNLDDRDMPVFTVRAAFVGLFFIILCSVLNTFFFFRYPSPSLNALIVEMLAYPLGIMAAKFAPVTVYHLPTWLPGRLSGAEWTLNDGPFNVKEHALIVIMANVGVAQAYGLHLIVVGDLFYGKSFGFGFGFLIVLCTQLLGFSIAGFAQRFVVYPASMLWPEALSVAANLNAFHAHDDAFSGKISRLKLLVIVLGVSIAYFWLPGYFMLFLSTFSWVTWIRPDNKTINALFGSNYGLGMGIFTFDWVQITLIGNPLVIPWWAQVNIIIGFLLFYWLIVPLIYFNNIWYTSYLPINTQEAGDRFAESYDVFRILGKDGRIDQAAYEAYSPIYVSASLNMTYTVAYALTTAMLVHTALWHGPRLWRGFRNQQVEAPDIHAKLMREYETIPRWWYSGVFLVLFALSIVCVQVFDTDLPVWGLILAILLPIIYFLPAAFIYASTAQIMTLNLIAQLIPGFAFAGRPVAVMISKTMSLQVLTQGLIFVQDMKLGHYMKLPPRSVFFAQLIGTVITCLIQVATKTLLFDNVPGICEDDRADGLTCDFTKTFFTSTVVWGLIGPARLWSRGSVYHDQIYALIGGAVAPVIVFILARRWPKSWLRNINIPVFLNGPLFVPPGSGINYGSFVIVGCYFQYYKRRKDFAWWSKYNYIIAAALDAGAAFGAVSVWLLATIPGAHLEWWGTVGYMNTSDFRGESARFAVPEGGYGPDTWK